MKKILLIFLNTLIIILFLEIVFKFYDFIQEDYFEKKKNIISKYSDYKNHPTLIYTAKKNSAGYEIHYTAGTYFKTTTNSDGFRTKEFYPKLKDKFRILLLGDSFVFGMNANDNETLAFNLEKKYQNKISKNIEVFSLGVTGYSGLNYLGIARTYFEYLNPDLVILCIDQSDLNDDESKIKFFDYEYDDQGYPYFVKNLIGNKSIRYDLSRNIEIFQDKEKFLIDKIKLESSLFNKINFLRHKLKKNSLEKRLKNINSTKYEIINYNKLNEEEKKYLHKIVNSGDTLKYDLQESLERYSITYNSLEYIKKKLDKIDATMMLSTYPYAWYINPEYSKHFQIKNFKKILDFRGNRVYPNLINIYADRINVEHLNSYDFFEKNPGKFWGDFDPHFNADGYKLYADYLFLNTKDFINNKLKK